MPTDHLVPDPASIPPYTVGRRGDSRRYRDLCSTCNHAVACGGRSTPQRPIVFCEEFDVFIPMPVAAPALDVSARAGKRQIASKRPGLCMNCDNAETCTTPKPEGGIWHCQEYQ